MNILGIQGGFTLGQHDAGAALVMNGKLIAMCEEERFLRIKAARGHMPIFSIQQCLKEGKISIRDIDLVVCSGETYKHFKERIELFLEHYFGYAPKVKLVHHQLAHLSSAYFASGFEEAMCISYDFRGDGLSTALATGKNGTIEIVKTIEAQHSLGLFYALVTQFLGFSIGEDEYKLMGLAPYGEDKYDFSDFLRITGDYFEVNQDYVRLMPPASSGVEPMYSKKLQDLLGGPPRHVGEPITQRHKDIACSTQRHLEKCLINLITQFNGKTKLPNLCLAGGVALNCSANGKILQLPFVEKLFVQPAATDRGLALGCALWGAAQRNQKVEALEHVFWGPTYTDDNIEQMIKLSNFRHKRLKSPAQTAARYLADGKVIGWFQGRSEFGPRALGNRSILADPRDQKMKDVVNSKIKFREEFRPFAPACIEEAAPKIFKLKQLSPFMTFAVQVQPDFEKKMGATTHIDGSARVQTVSSKASPRFHELITEFEKLSGIPVVLNTSFNIKGQPIVETPLDAIATFSSTGLDALFLGDFLLEK